MKTGKIEFSPDYKSEKSVSKALESIKRFKQNNPPNPCDGFSPDEYLRLVEWMRDPKRKPAIIAFTAGHTRDAARAFEEYLKEGHKPAAPRSRREEE